MKKIFTRKEVKLLLEQQKEKIYRKIGRLPMQAGDEEILSAIRKCKLIKLP